MSFTGSQFNARPPSRTPSARTTVLLCTGVAFLLPAAGAQIKPCALTSVQDGNVLQYPTIARAAHVSGVVTVATTFGPDRKAEIVYVKSGPEMLKNSALEYVRHWKANPSNEARECEAVLDYRLIPGGFDDNCKLLEVAEEGVRRQDIQHVFITRVSFGTCDPAATISYIQHRFLFFHWKTNVVRDTP